MKFPSNEKIIILFLLIATHSQAQVTDSSNKVKDGFFLKVYDDTTSSSIPIYEESDSYRDNSFFDSLESKANKKSWSRQLHDILIIDYRKQSSKDKNNGHSRVLYFENFKGKRIRNIKHVQLDVFGPSFNDTSKIADNWFKRMGNSLHISTLSSALNGYLFIEEGEIIDPYLLSDNERILRTIPSIHDAQIYVVPVNGSPDEVDLQILTKDVWSIGFSGEVLDLDYFNFSIWNNNVLGLGHRLAYTTYFNNEKTPKLGYKVQYKLPNIGNTLSTFRFLYQNKWNLQMTQASITRDFISPSLRFGGGIEYEKKYSVSNLRTLDSTYIDIKSEYEFYETWGGYSMPIMTYAKQKLRKTFFITGLWSQYVPLIRPNVEKNYFYDYHNKILYLGSFGMAWQGYHDTRMVYGFGATEDIPYGTMVKFTGGYENGEFSNRYYAGTTLAAAGKIKKMGFISGNLQLGSFYDDSPEQGVMQCELLHISPLFGASRHKFRNFTNLVYYQGFNRFGDEYISFFEDDGIRGLDYYALKGNKKLWANTEFVYYSPHYLIGFRFVYFSFADLGIINYKSKSLFSNPLYSSVGIGVRIRNERLVFNTLQIRMQFFPFNRNIPWNSKEFIEMSGIPEYRMPDFAERKPEIVEYD